MSQTIEEIAAYRNSDGSNDSPIAVVAREILALRKIDHETAVLWRTLTDAVVTDAQKLSDLEARLDAIATEPDGERPEITDGMRMEELREQVKDANTTADFWHRAWVRVSSERQLLKPDGSPIILQIAKAAERELIEGNGWLSCSWILNVVGQQPPDDDGEWMRGVG